MTNAINNMGNSTPLDMGNASVAAQSSMQAGTHFSSVRMFSTDSSGDAGNTHASSAGGAQHAHAHHAHHAAAGGDSDGSASQSAGAAGQGGSGSDASGAMNQIFDMIKSVISAATELVSPILGMITSMMGQADASGKSGAGAA
ncbi:hypothetical protein [Paraburkholderia haematera]|jgi:hypothetical protein|uniref:Uncharacterized protein n=1 Tax=Paraburkholderia haematera TaxID=2793077 RepID=A0ABM8SMU5_9BURK|nr:hypothetical protein [Paraburkholderia haematera]CAE6819989.1 hypothetical protein R69888_06058 [Paraburkholderia haematera]